MQQKEIEHMVCGTGYRTAFLWHVPTLISAGSLPEKFFDALYDGDLDNFFEPAIVPEGTIEKFFNGTDDERIERWETEELMIDLILRNKDKFKSFIAKIECPVYQTSASGYINYSWGHYSSKYVMVDNIDELLLAGEQFEQEMRNEAKQA